MQACQAEGRPFFVVCLEGQAAHDLPVTENGETVPHIWLPLGAAGKLFDVLKSENINEIVMIGHVRRPSLFELKPDWLALKIVTSIGFNSLGDDGLLTAVGKAIEAQGGVRVIGAHEILNELLTPSGTLTMQQPDDEAMRDIERGVSVARALGALDVGQSVVVQQGVVLGVEAAEGTDALLTRCATLRRDGLGGVLVKMAKPQQDNRFDLPTVGESTITAASSAGLRGIVIESGRSLLLNRQATIHAADAAKLFMCGI